MKKYLEIYVGSRGYLEGVGEVEKDNIEEWLESESVENKKWIEEDEERDEDVKDELEKKGFKNTITRSELHTLLRQMKKDKLIYYRYQYAVVSQFEK